MSRLARGACAFALVAGTVAVRARGREAPASRVHASTPLRVAFEAGVDSLAESLQRLDVALGSKSDPSVRSAFRDARRMYKHQETLLEYYSPSTVSIANGPPPEEDDETPARPLGEPAAFQRIEHVAFGTIIPADSDVARARADVRLIRDAVVHFRSQTRLIAVSDLQMLDAARLELARVSALWLAGVDSDESGDAVIESASALDGVRALAAVAEKSDASSAHDERWHALDAALSSAIAQLRADSNVSTMNRLAFIAVHAARVGKQIMSARMALAPLNETLRTVWRPTAETLFDADAFDASAYTQGFALPATPDAVALGERLFHDARLSGPQTRSCASCHVPRLAFTDGLPKQPAIGGQGFVSRNTPTLLNAALQPTQFADGRAATLEAQIDVVLSSPSEMASSADIAARRLNEDSSYRRAFARVSTARRGQPVTPMLLRAVLATYVRSLVSLDSRFDLAVRGDTNALSASERRGFTLFMGKGACGTCHFAPLFNGARPPVLVAAESEIIGVPAKSDTVRATLDPDEGLGVVDIRPEHLHAFKVPSLRNVELTAPYMHNGAYASLEQVVDFYNRGGGTGIGATVPAQSLAPRPLHLTDAEQHDVVAFLKSLTGRTRTTK